MTGSNHVVRHTMVDIQTDMVLLLETYAVKKNSFCSFYMAGLEEGISLYYNTSISN